MNKRKNGKGIDIRKGINIEKNVKIVSDENGAMRPTQEFDIIQHSQSNFSGVKGVLVKQTRHDGKSKAALQSFANAGGANHLLEPIEDDRITTEDDDLSVNEFQNEEDEWQTDNGCQRWIVKDMIKPLEGNIFAGDSINTTDYMLLIETLNKPITRVINIKTEPIN